MRSPDTVLVVDDEPGTLGFLTEALEEAGLSVLVAVDGDAALSIVDRRVPEIILLDAVMPGRDGFETCRALKAKPALAHVPIVFMTGLSETEHIVRGFESGGTDYTTKPIVTAELIARVRVHLAGARMRRNAYAALEATGRLLLACDGTGRILWTTPQVDAMVAAAVGDGAGGDTGGVVLPARCRAWFAEAMRGGGAGTVGFPAGPRFPPMVLSFVNRIGEDEYLLRLAATDAHDRAKLLQERLGLTRREAEVLLWIVHGKANRDIAEILDMKPRTVEKHLQQLYAKLGVENRTAATGRAVQAVNLF